MRSFGLIFVLKAPVLPTTQPPLANILFCCPRRDTNGLPVSNTFEDIGSAVPTLGAAWFGHGGLAGWRTVRLSLSDSRAAKQRGEGSDKGKLRHGALNHSIAADFAVSFGARCRAAIGRSEQRLFHIALRFQVLGEEVRKTRQITASSGQPRRHLVPGAQPSAGRYSDLQR